MYPRNESTLGVFQDVWHGAGEDCNSGRAEDLWPGGEEDLCSWHHQNSNRVSSYDGHRIHQTLVRKKSICGLGFIIFIINFIMLLVLQVAAAAGSDWSV